MAIFALYFIQIVDYFALYFVDYSYLCIEFQS